MLNKYLAIGNLTSDPKKQSIKETNLVTFSLAINNPVKKDDVCFVDIETWGKNADNCAKFLKKGSKVFIEGRLKYNCWEAKDGSKRCKVSCVADYVQFMSSKNEDNLEKQETKNNNQDLAEEFDELADIPF